MSGIEVAGLALGALPVLFGALDCYKKGIGRVRSGLRKREHVSRLARALRLQERSLISLMEDILQQSGCELPDDELKLPSILNHESTLRSVDDYLGHENAVVLMDTLSECLQNLQRIAEKVARWVPLLKADSAIREILDANRMAEKGRLDFFARISVAVSLSDLQQEIEKLNSSTDALDRFANRIMGQRRLDQSSPSKKAMKFARQLKTVRQNTQILHSALDNHWSKSCHLKHELKLFLDDRIMKKPLDQKLRAETGCFRAVFAGGTIQTSPLWYDTAIVPISDDNDCNTTTSGTVRVQIVMPSPQKAAGTRRAVRDICTEIEDAARSNLHPVFHLLTDETMAVLLQSSANHVQYSRADSLSLQAILSNNNSDRRPLPWKSRMILALKLASSFLQFLRTPWMQDCWSPGDICFLTGCNTRQVDLSQPYLSREFGQASDTTYQVQLQIKTDLVELGILLLDIWHETTLEARFPGQASLLHESHTRHAFALKWLDDVQNPLPDLYYKAVSHCLMPVFPSVAQNSEWDDIKLWNAICENIIDPLSKVAQV